MTTTPENAVPLTRQEEVEKMVDEGDFPIYAAKVAKEKNIPDIEARLHDPHSELAKDLYEAFTKSEYVKEELKSLFREDVEGMVVLEDFNLRSIDDYVNTQRIKKPESIRVLADQIEQVRKDASEMEARESAIEKAKRARDKEIADFISEKKKLYERTLAQKDGSKVKEVASMIHKEETSFDMMSPSTWKRTIWSEGGARKIVEQELAILNQNGEMVARAKGKGETIDEQLKELHEAQEKQKESYTRLKSVLLQKADYAASIHQATQEKIKMRVQAVLFNPTKSLADLDAEQGVLSRVAQQKKDKSSFNYLSDADYASLQKDINAESEKIAVREIEDKISSLTLSGGAFSQLENSIMPYIKDRESLGTKNKEQTKKFILTSLKTKLAALKAANNVDDSAKSIVLGTLIRKIQAIV